MNCFDFTPGVGPPLNPPPESGSWSVTWGEKEARAMPSYLPYSEKCTPTSRPQLSWLATLGCHLEE